MTTAKAWRQKGTGRARAWARSACRTAGGAAFGPKPRGHTIKVNRKARRRASRRALGARRPRLGRGPRRLGLLRALDQAGGRGARQVGRPAAGPRGPRRRGGARRQELPNISKVTVLPASAAGVADVIGHRSLIVSQAALPVLEARAGDVKRGGAEEAGE